MEGGPINASAGGAQLLAPDAAGVVLLTRSTSMKVITATLGDASVHGGSAALSIVGISRSRVSASLSRRIDCGGIYKNSNCHC